MLQKEVKREAFGIKKKQTGHIYIPIYTKNTHKDFFLSQLCSFDRYSKDT